MTSPAIVGAAAAREASIQAVPAAGATATPRTGGGPSSRRRRPWWRRLRIPSLPPRPTDELWRSGLEQVLALLEGARTELEAGWAQGGWWSAAADGGQRAAVTGLAAGFFAPESASAVCLVGALVRAASRQGPGAEVGRAIDAVHDALWESRGQPSAEPGPGLPAVSSPQVRLARVRTLTRWNDAAQRTGDEVLAIVDRAIARTILSLASPRQ